MGNDTLIKSIILILAVSFLSVELKAASCCGGGASLPGLVLGDYQGQFVVSFSNAAITHDSNPDGAIKKRYANNQQVNERVVLTGAYLLNPLLQVGATVPYQFTTYRTEANEEASNGLGDIKLQTAYEFLPEYSYSAWKPRGFIFFEGTIATSNSIYDATKPFRTDSFGNGLNVPSVGFLFMKTYPIWDYLSAIEVHHGFNRSFKQSGQSFKVLPGFGATAMISIGYSPGGSDFRIGSSLTYAYESKKEIVGLANQTSATEEVIFAEVGVNISYLYRENSFTLSYNDQVFLGVSQNTVLTRSLGFSFVQFVEL
jgi:hypothetical protein